MRHPLRFFFVRLAAATNENENKKFPMFDVKTLTDRLHRSTSIEHWRKRDMPIVEIQGQCQWKKLKFHWDRQFFRPCLFILVSAFTWTSHRSNQDKHFSSLSFFTVLLNLKQSCIWICFKNVQIFMHGEQTWLLWSHSKQNPNTTITLCTIDFPPFL